METLRCSIHINAPRERVWEVMLGPDTYPTWTKVFNPTSRSVGDWSEGSRMRFVGTDERTGREGGMLARVAVNRPYEYLSLEHLGLIEDGVEDTTSAAVKEWAPAFENYTFEDSDGGTTLTVTQDIDPMHRAQFEVLWPQALAALKQIAERGEPSEAS